MYRLAVSEVIGTLLLVGVVVMGITLVGLLLIANPLPSKVPVFDSIISNRSNTIYIYHKGGDPLWAGQYQILVDGGDQTGNFTISGGTDPWSVGETLTATSPVIPRRVAIVLNQSGGGATYLAGQDLYPIVSVPQAESAWYFNQVSERCDWDYRKQITIDRTKVSGTLSDFPVLVSLTDSDLASKAQRDGDDILFTASDGTTRLPHEIESYMGNTGTLVAWVKVPSITSTTDTVIYMYYGNTTSTSQQSASSVWDANYKGVWHLSEAVTDEATGGTHTDSTSPQNNGGQYRNDDAIGKINRSQYFDGTVTYDWINVADSPDLDMTASQDFTVSAWVSTTQAAVAGTWPAMVRKVDDDGSPANGYSLILHSGVSTVWYFEEITAGHIDTAGGDTNIADGAWHYIAGARSGSTLITYEDGNLADSNPGGTSADLSQAYPFRMASSCEGAPTAGLIYKGNLDEVRLSKYARSADWVKTEYNNQNSPSTFTSAGSEERWWRC